MALKLGVPVIPVPAWSEAVPSGEIWTTQLPFSGKEVGLIRFDLLATFLRIASWVVASILVLSATGVLKRAAGSYPE